MLKYTDGSKLVMNKRMNIIFFSICFIASLLAETYYINNSNVDLLSMGGIGIIVLITGYLLLDSIRGQIVDSSNKVKFALDKLYQEEKEKWNERYTEMENLQKATYTATKKNTVVLRDKFEELLLKLDAMEKSNDKVLQKMIDLQKKSLEGQKNALNLEINYNKENTKQLMKVLREESKSLNQEEKLTAILNQLEKNYDFQKEIINKVSYGNPKDSDNLQTKQNSTDAALPKAVKSEPELEALKEEELQDTKEQPKVVPLYDDPNKALTADEIASLFASFDR